MGKNIAIFADGTGNTVASHERHESNVLRLCRMADIRNRRRQLLIYDPGVGTCTTTEEFKREFPTADGPLFIRESTKSSLLARRAVWALGLLFGYGTERNIKQLYGALAEHYEPGDRVYIFGFSRGAFTARSLAGLIYRCGLVRSSQRDKVEEGYCLYRKHFEQARNSRELGAKKQKVDKFRRVYSHPCNIRFLGIFDTVKSVGYLNPKNLPHTRHNPIVQTVRHALSLDERRSFYVATTWGGVDTDTRPAIYVPACWDAGACSALPVRWQDVEEVWFAGCHSDVGGGYPPQFSSPADVSLRWMLEEARAHGLLVSDTANVNRLARKIIKEHLHDEMTRRGIWKIVWWVGDHFLRRDLDNEPPPPRKNWRCTPAGPREIGASIRKGTILVHSTAKSRYAQTAPWSGMDVRFIDTIEH